MQLRVLGCSGGIGQERRTTCFQVDNDILIDSGTGVGELSLEEMSALRHIFLTHSHLDHIGGLPLLIDSIFTKIQEPIVIHGLEETIQALKDFIFNWAIWPDFSMLPHEKKPVMRFEVMKPGETVDVGGRKLEMIEVNHVVPGVAYCVESDAGAIAFSGDTTTNDTLWEALNKKERLDILIVETAFPDELLDLSKLAKHYCPSLLAEDLKKLKHNPSIYISHLKPGGEVKILSQLESQVDEHRRLLRLSNGDVFEL
ncbi:MBL fold metallo-hydrolase [Candidatus Reidiella endopervernicosa]|nr:3',5'-cyclic-nucleotide phosphodiesterase [Candidatus Reidiella endopervernicosa]QKQ26273.1 3',5'-cyclic-nucleotide phosphodiesterase [Candidatus Reidiella endopervernicosa]